MIGNGDHVTLHGVLVSIDNTGVLVVGEAGLGKSDFALQLINRGHALVADDVVGVRRGSGGLEGSAPSRFRRLLNVRGIGIIDVVQIFGPRAFQEESAIGIMVEVVSASAQHSGRETVGNILGITIPKFVLVCPTPRDLSVLIETAVRVVSKPRSIKVPEAI